MRTILLRRGQSCQGRVGVVTAAPLRLRIPTTAGVASISTTSSWSSSPADPNHIKSHFVSSTNSNSSIYSRTTLLRASATRATQTLRHYHVSTPPLQQLQQDDVKANDRLLVVGSGVAGSAAALIAAELYKIPVTMIFAGQLPTDCNSFWAQGGIIYRNYDEASGDSAASLAADIHRAGAGLCDDGAVQKVSNEGPDRVRQLLLQGGKFAQVPFDRREDGEYSLCLEASHAAPRILHKADHTGRIITQHITAAAAAHPLITQVPRTVVTDVLVTENPLTGERVCTGVETLSRTTGRMSMIKGYRGVVLASGGLAGIYEHSTNPAGFNALGSSVALAVRAGVTTQDLEFVQFHPTALYIPNEARFLLSEALRGEGAVLRDAAGRAFARDYHEAGELAPRDIVARAVFQESQKGDGVTHNCYLDITHRDGPWLHQRFPSIQEHLQARGLDLATTRLPVIPAAHYTCGGIATDLQGKTNLTGLYAAGEAARTGLHGGNRLASTSLLEGLVFGASVADFLGSTEGSLLRDQALAAIAEGHPTTAGSPAAQQPQKQKGFVVQRRRKASSLDPMLLENTAHRAMQLLQSLRRTMWDHVGLVRTPAGLRRARAKLTDVCDEILYLHNTCPTLETAAVRDAAYAGLAVTRAALANRTSKGAHCIILSDKDEETETEDELSNKAEDSDEEEQQVAAAR